MIETEEEFTIDRDLLAAAMRLKEAEDMARSCGFTFPHDNHAPPTAASLQRAAKRLEELLTEGYGNTEVMRSLLHRWKVNMYIDNLL